MKEQKNEPRFHRTILEAGDESAGHSAFKGASDLVPPISPIGDIS